MHGTVKWVRGNRGYGFIAPGDGGGDIFFLFDDCEAALLSPGAPSPGDAVNYRTVDGPRGPQASSVGRATGAPLD